MSVVRRRDSCAGATPVRGTSFLAVSMNYDCSAFQPQLGRRNKASQGLLLLLDVSIQVPSTNEKGLAWMLRLSEMMHSWRPGGLRTAAQTCGVPTSFLQDLAST